MRIWSLHPKYLDTKGLVALWREALLAKHVLEGATRGYTRHPQLDRFKKADRPLDCMNQYLAAVYQEAVERGYRFGKEKIDWGFRPSKLAVTKGQVRYEAEHLLSKLKSRDPERYDAWSKKRKFNLHPLFDLVEGDIEEWERYKPHH